MSAGPHRAVRAVIPRPERAHGPGFSTRSLRPPAGLSLDPFLSFDEFHMSMPTFPPHPHAGFSAVTVMLEDSAGAFINRDSLGDRSRIGPGDVHWTQAAAGMMHEEVPEQPGVDCHGVQIFVKLSRQHELAPPRAMHLSASEIPVITSPGARVRVVVGALGDVRAPIEGLLTPARLLDVTIEPDTTLSLPAPAGWTTFAAVLRGDGLAEGAPGVAFSEHDGVLWAEEGELITLTAGAEGLQLLMASGPPLREPVVFAGPFAMSSNDRLAAAGERFRRGELGRLTPSFGGAR
ncbi:pirin family protein [Myxococcota bacterium]|nr:pirin family protein [Myxococcota bacterium]